MHCLSASPSVLLQERKTSPAGLCIYISNHRTCKEYFKQYEYIKRIFGLWTGKTLFQSDMNYKLTCCQEQLKAAVKQIIEVIKKPFYAIRDAIKTVVQTVKVIVKKIKEILLTIKRIVMAIGDNITPAICHLLHF